MQESARKILKDWQADLAIVGLVKKSEEALTLWFVPHEGDDTLDSGDAPYRLVDVTLPSEFHNDFNAQIVALALTVATPFANTETLGNVLERELVDVIGKIKHLLDHGTINVPDQRARLRVTLGTALRVLGERESGTERLEQAVTAYQAALEEQPRERVPLNWATIQNNLGNALNILGERESGTERLEQAVMAYEAALEELTRERVPLDWDQTQNNLAATLSTLGERESSTERLEQAMVAYQAALEEWTRERVPLDWARTQNNLGNALSRLGKCETSIERFEQAVTTYQAALEELTRERVPLDWAGTQHNLKFVQAIINSLKNINKPNK